MHKALQKARDQKRHGRYIQEEQALTLDEVIEQGIADLKARLADENRLTVQDVIEHKKRELSSSTATSNIQVFDRTASYTKAGFPEASHLEVMAEAQGLTLHQSRYTRDMLAGAMYPTGVMLGPIDTTMKDGRPSPIIFTPSTGVGSVGFSNTRKSNTVRQLPADLEPLFYAYITNHEEGHALDCKFPAHEVDHSSIYRQVFKDDIDEIERISDAVEGKEVALSKVAQTRDEWLRSLNETRQDIYGLLKTTEFAKERGYCVDDVLTLIDYVHDMRITTPAESMKKYAVHKGIAATRRLIETKGFDAVEHVENMGYPTTPKEEEIFNMHERALHFGVREWVYNRELYMDGGAYVAFIHTIEHDTFPAEESLNEAQKKELQNTMAEREKATQRILRPQAAEQITLEDARTLNAIIARQSTAERQSLELLSISDGVCAALEEYAENGEIDTVFGRFTQSKNAYMNRIALSDTGNFLNEMPEPEEKITSPKAVLYIDQVNDGSKNPQKLLISIRKGEGKGQFIMESSPAPQDKYAIAKVAETAYENNVVFCHSEDVTPVKAMAAAAHSYETLQDPSDAYQRTKFDGALEDKTARKAYLTLVDMFEGKIHHLDAYDTVIDHLKESAELDSEDVYLAPMKEAEDEMELDR